MVFLRVNFLVKYGGICIYLFFCKLLVGNIRKFVIFLGFLFNLIDQDLLIYEPFKVQRLGRFQEGFGFRIHFNIAKFAVN